MAPKYIWQNLAIRTRTMHIWLQDAVQQPKRRGMRQNSGVNPQGRIPRSMPGSEGARGIETLAPKTPRVFSIPGHKLLQNCLRLRRGSPLEVR
jgi:hypothetical protein